MQPRLAILLAGPLLCALPLGAQVTTKLIASGLTRPLWAGAPDGDERIFIAQKGGQIRILQNGAVLTRNFLGLGGRVSTGSEQGLLGLDFHPDYANNGFFYVNYTDLAGDTVVSRFSVTADPNLADLASEMVLFTIDQPFDNHNGGDLHFGPDGYLYVFLGDGGSANDPGCRAQKLNHRLGKILRIDVDSGTPYAIPPTNPFAGGLGVTREVFHYGVRNPWRNSFDRLTGDLFIGDVGQDLREEISVAPAGSAGLNFGWKMMEGILCNSTTNCLTGTPACNDATLVAPIAELLHSHGARCITGGYVYRGCACPSESGKYFYADFADDHIRSLVYDRTTGTVSGFADRTAELAPGGSLAIRDIASFGEDGFGELLIIDHGGAAGTGELYKMVPAAATAATNVVQNGAGGNPQCLSAASLPILGNVWEARVDTTGHPPGSTILLYGYSAPASGIFIGGRRYEVLLDSSSRRLFREFRLSSGGSDAIRLPFPCTASLAGVPFYVQAVVLGTRLQLCNALEVTPGYY
jgi:hypothetical protein